MKTGTARYAKHYEIAAYGESAVRWGYNHWWSKTFLLGFSANTFNNLGRTTKADIACGWGLTEGPRSDIRYRNIAPKGLSQARSDESVYHLNPDHRILPAVLLPPLFQAFLAFFFLSLRNCLPLESLKEARV